MPIIYLSPSTQENNYYVSGGTEEQYMNRLADALVPYLDASGIRYTRNTPDMTAAGSIAASNAGNYDLHLALHSNAAPDGQYGSARGSIAFYFPTSSEGRRAATLIANNLKVIYPDPNLVRAESTVSIGEVRRVRAPAVLLELAFHDNVEDAAWITGNIPLIARNLALSLTEFFAIPFFDRRLDRAARVDVSFGSLNIRTRPRADAPIAVRAPNAAPLTVLNGFGGWYLVDYNGTLGYAAEEFVRLD